MSQENKFVDGLFIKKPRENAPDFVKGGISIKRIELIEWLRKESDEFINLDIKESQKGSWYASVNEWKPEKGYNTPQQTKQTEIPAEKEQIIPF